MKMAIWGLVLLLSLFNSNLASGACITELINSVDRSLPVELKEKKVVEYLNSLSSEITDYWFNGKAGKGISDLLKNHGSIRKGLFNRSVHGQVEFFKIMKFIQETQLADSFQHVDSVYGFQLALFRVFREGNLGAKVRNALVETPYAKRMGMDGEQMMILLNRLHYHRDQELSDTELRELIEKQMIIVFPPYGSYKSLNRIHHWDANTLYSRHVNQENWSTCWIASSAKLVEKVISNRLGREVELDYDFYKVASILNNAEEMLMTEYHFDPKLLDDGGYLEGFLSLIEIHGIVEKGTWTTKETNRFDILKIIHSNLKQFFKKISKRYTEEEISNLTEDPFRKERLKYIKLLRKDVFGKFGDFPKNKIIDGKVVRNLDLVDEYLPEIANGVSNFVLANERSNKKASWKLYFLNEHLEPMASVINTHVVGLTEGEIGLGILGQIRKDNPVAFAYKVTGQYFFADTGNTYIPKNPLSEHTLHLTLIKAIEVDLSGRATHVTIQNSYGNIGDNGDLHMRRDFFRSHFAEITILKKHSIE